MMDGNILAGGGSGILADLNALERLNAMSSRFGGGMNTGQWVAVSLVVVLLSAGALVGLVTLFRRLRQVRRFRQAFGVHSERVGISERERHVLWAMARAARLRNPEAIYTSTVAFESGESALLKSARITIMSEDRRRGITGIIELLREKLALAGQEHTGDGMGPADTSAIAEGEELSVVYRGDAAELTVQVRESTADTLVVEPSAPVECEQGEAWLIRYARGGTLWEIDTTVHANDGDLIYLGRRGAPRFINRRRFPRVPTSRQAQVASFPFWREDMPRAAKDVVDGELVEIAGPGLRVEAPMNLGAGERVLLALQLGENHVVEALGKVHRASRAEGGESAFIVELLGLNEDEIATLTQATNAAARENADRDQRAADDDENEPGGGNEQAADSEAEPADEAQVEPVAEPASEPVGANT